MYYVIKEPGPDGTGAFAVAQEVDGKVLVESVFLSEDDANNWAETLNKLMERLYSAQETEETEETEE